MPEQQKLIDLTKLGEGGSILQEPVIWNKKVYFGSCDNYFYCLDAATGEKQWEFKTGDKILSGSIIVKINSKKDKTIICFGSFDKYFYALNIETGKLAWKFRTGGIIFSSPVVCKDMILFGSCDHHLYALDFHGKKKWKFRTGGEVYSSLVVDHDKARIYFGSEDCYFYCLDKNGKEQWRSRTGGPIFEYFHSCYHDGIVYFGSMDQCIYALDAETGKEQWHFRTGDDVNTTPVVHKGVIYVGGRDSYLYALNAKTGELLWAFKSNGYIPSSVIVHKNRIYFGACFPDSHLYALTLDGKVIWRFRTNYGAEGITIYKNTIYFTTWDCYLYAIGLDGSFKWKFRTKSGRISTPEGVRPPPKIMGKWVGVFAKRKELRREPTRYDRTFTEQGEIEPEKYIIGEKEYAPVSVTEYDRAMGREGGMTEKEREHEKLKKLLKDERRW